MSWSRILIFVRTLVARLYTIGVTGIAATVRTYLRATPLILVCMYLYAVQLQAACSLMVRYSAVPPTVHHPPTSHASPNTGGVPFLSLLPALLRAEGLDLAVCAEGRQHPYGGLRELQAERRHVRRRFHDSHKYRRLEGRSRSDGCSIQVRLRRYVDAWAPARRFPDNFKLFREYVQHAISAMCLRHSCGVSSWLEGFTLLRIRCWFGVVDATVQLEFWVLRDQTRPRLRARNMPFVRRTSNLCRESR